tara:strand:+ start:3721 stop:3987 length:267 start_codon:yes stop_codon:yes gene_type:complete
MYKMKREEFIMSAVSAKPLSPKGLRKFIESLPAERKRESIERQLRLLPRFIMEEVARKHPSEKVIKHLEACLKEVRLLALVENYGREV